MTGRTLVPRALVVLGTLFAAVGLLAVYVRMTALDDGEARSLARQLISRPDLRAQIAATSVDQLYANVDVAGLLRSRLPSGERGVAGPLAASLRGVAKQGVDSLLEQPAVQALWTNAVDRTHRQVVAIVENKSPVVGASNGDAVLDLRPLVLRAGERVGIGADLAQRLPAVAGRITILRSDDLRSAERGIRVLNWVADWFWLLAIGTWAAAIWISRAAPRRVVRGIGVGLVLTGLALLALRSLAGHYVVHSLVSAQSARPAASTAWSVVTARLADSAWTTLGVGVVVLVGLWLQSGRRSHAARYALAPLLRSADVAFGLLAALLLLLFWWGPTIETREWRGIALIAAGSVVAYELLRRRTAREFPDAGLGEAWASLRNRFASPVRELEPPADEVDRLERLTRLHESGALSAEEFEAAKRALLGTGTRARDRSPG